MLSSLNPGLCVTERIAHIKALCWRAGAFLKDPDNRPLPRLVSDFLEAVIQFVLSVHKAPKIDQFLPSLMFRTCLKPTLPQAFKKTLLPSGVGKGSTGIGIEMLKALFVR